MARKNKPRGGRVDGRSANRPPEASRFKPGQSGNPKGRPKGSKNEATILHELFSRKIEVREGHRVRKVQFLEALFLRLCDTALRGDRQVTVMLLDRYASIPPYEKQSEPLRRPTKGMDAEALMRLYQESLKRLKY